jgi:hypothetical protein
LQAHSTFPASDQAENKGTKQRHQLACVRVQIPCTCSGYSSENQSWFLALQELAFQSLDDVRHNIETQGWSSLRPVYPGAGQVAAMSKEMELWDNREWWGLWRLELSYQVQRRKLLVDSRQLFPYKSVISLLADLLPCQ